MESYLRVNLLGPGPSSCKKLSTGPRSHKGWETPVYGAVKCMELVPDRVEGQVLVSAQLNIQYHRVTAYFVNA
jgi:hypothetical protein